MNRWAFTPRSKELADLKKGASVAIPMIRQTAEERFRILAAAGLIKMKDGVGVNGTPLDITR